MLWHIEDTNLHLLASLHVLEQTRQGLFPEAEWIYQNAQRVTFEHDFTAPPSSALTDNPQDTPLSAQLPAAIFAKVTEVWTTLSLPMERLEQVQPWVAAMSIFVIGAARRGILESCGVDRVLWGRAEYEGKTRTTLEKTEDALAIFGMSPEHEKISFLEYAVNLPTNLQDDLDAMIDAWHAHDDGLFERILNHRFSMWPVGFGQLIIGRNQVWIPRIMQLATDKIPTLIVVGALHCVGKTGLPKLLENHGMRLSRVV